MSLWIPDPARSSARAAAWLAEQVRKGLLGRQAAADVEGALAVLLERVERETARSCGWSEGRL